MRFIRHLSFLLISCMTLTAIQASATPRRRTVKSSKSARGHHKARRRPISTTPASRRTKRRAINRRARRNSVTPARQPIRAAERRSERRSKRRVERRRSERRVERRRSERRVERRRVERRRSERRAVRRNFRRGTVRRSRHHYPNHRTYRPYTRVRRRPIPLYVSAPPSRVVIDTHVVCHGRDDDHFFDTIYHDGGRYGINGDLTDEEYRINDGIAHGLITPNEARRLQNMLWEIYALEDHTTADGFLTEEEEADLYWAERDLNRAIRWETQDFEVW